MKVSCMLKASGVALLGAASAFCQSSKAPLAFEAVDIQLAKPGDQVSTLGILPDGHVYFRNVAPRKIIATAYNLDESSVTGGPGWLDSDRLDLVAKASATSSQADRLAMLQALLAERFKLAIRHDPKTTWEYALTVSKDGAKLQAAATSGISQVAQIDGEPRQVHFRCRGISMQDLAELLPEVAPNYLNLPVADKTGLQGVYDFQMDWMGAKAEYDAAAVAVSAGAAKDPLAVSVFDAVAKLGLSLEKREVQSDAIVVEKAEPLAAKGSDAKADPATISELTADKLSRIDSLVHEEMQTEQIPGLAVGVYSRGEILLAKGYGLANVELNVPVRPETIFQSGSVGKQFVSAAIMLLVEEGKVGLDDSIVKYFPNAPGSWKPILVKNLLSHTSGLAEYATGERIGPKGAFYLRLDFSEDELVEKVEALPIESAPGERWDYRNTNYLLLGIMIHKVTGKYFDDYLQERIFKPWYMGSTRVISDSDIVPNRASGYRLAGRKLKNQHWVSPTFNFTGDGTMYFTVLDLAKWDEALYGTSMLKQSSLDSTWTVFALNDGQPNRANYGFGWFISKVNGHKLIQHGGSWQGFTCTIQRYVDDNLTVVVLTNMAGANPVKFANGIAGIVNPALAPPPPKERKEVAVDSKLFSGYVGKYQVRPDLVITITVENNHLFFQETNRTKVLLFAEGERDFFLKVIDAQITFVTDSQGRTTELILHRNGDQHAKRIE
jgi:uncharacterized protein (TIGR03435 family)